MTPLDLGIVILYLIVLVAIGVYFQRSASEGIDSYFLGNRRLPWWVLGASGMASNLDVSGTMINIALIYALGAAGFFVELRGGIVLIMAFLMIFMGKWNQRARVMTQAEWMELRFGKEREGRLARLTVAVANLVFGIWIVTYFAVGAGKFIGEFIGFPPWLGMPPEFWAAATMIALSMIYTVASGIYGVVWTDVFQGVFIFIAIISVVIIAMTQFDPPDAFMVSVPMRDGTFTNMPTTWEAWSSFMPDWELGLPEGSSFSSFNLLGITIIFYLLKVFIEGSAGVGGYMIQRFYAARSERDAGLLSAFWIFLLSFRWPFVAAIAIMGIGLGVQTGQVIDDPEKVLPVVIYQLLPVGLKGLLVAGLMAAAMSTFDSVVNASASYWVKDIYQAFIRPAADDRRLMIQSRVSSVIIVLLGLLFTLHISTINEIWGWLTMSIGAGLLVPLLVRWYWWRFNGYGFAAGILAGMLGAILQRLLWPDIPEYTAFSFVSALSLIGTFGGTMLFKATPQDTLINFYKITRPFGFWGPVAAVIPDSERRQIQTETRRDRLSILAAVCWQLVLFMTMMGIVLKRWDYVVILGAVFAGLSLFLYVNWFRHLE